MDQVYPHFTAVVSKVIQPKILYYGTPVVLLSTVNEDGTTNISPISSSWALGSMLVLGLGLGGKALENLQRNSDCVLNVASPNLWENVERLAPLTGMNPLPEYKRELFRYEKDKFAAAGFTPLPSASVAAQRIAECPLQIEAVVRNIRIPEYHPQFAVVEVEAVKVHAHEAIVVDEHHVNPLEWSPLIYNFRHYFGLGEHLGRTFRAER